MRVLDAGIWRPVPHATQLLADLGADVLKLEPPGHDPMRTFPDIFRDVASHKGSVVLDLRTRRRARRARSSSRRRPTCSAKAGGPGVADRLGVGYEHVKAVNPSIIYCSVSGYGQTGDLTALPGHDVNYQALAGAIAARQRGRRSRRSRRCRSPTSRPRPSPRSRSARRGRTGCAPAKASASTSRWPTWSRRGSVRARATRSEGRDEPTRGSTGYGVFRCADGGWLALGVIAEDHFWKAVCDGLGIAGLGDARRTSSGSTASRSARPR